jgi:hypothetical protein
MTDFYDRPGDTTIARFPLDVSAAPPAGSDDDSIATINRLTATS